MTIDHDIQAALEDLYGGDQHDEVACLLDKLEDRGLQVVRETRPAPDRSLFDDLPRPVVDVHLPEDAA